MTTLFVKAVIFMIILLKSYDFKTENVAEYTLISRKTNFYESCNNTKNFCVKIIYNYDNRRTQNKTTMIIASCTLFVVTTL